MPQLSNELKLTIKSRLWDGPTVTFDENEKSFTVSTEVGGVYVSQFLDLNRMRVYYFIKGVDVSPGLTSVHFMLFP